MTDQENPLRLEFLVHHLESGTLEGEEGKELAALIRQGVSLSLPEQGVTSRPATKPSGANT
jgi:hypothetical protein